MINRDYGIHSDGEYQLTKDLRELERIEAEKLSTLRKLAKLRIKNRTKLARALDKWGWR